MCSADGPCRFATLRMAAACSCSSVICTRKIEARLEGC